MYGSLAQLLPPLPLFLQKWNRCSVWLDFLFSELQEPHTQNVSELRTGIFALDNCKRNTESKNTSSLSFFPYFDKFKTPFSSAQEEPCLSTLGKCKRKQNKEDCYTPSLLALSLLFDKLKTPFAIFHSIPARHDVQRPGNACICVYLMPKLCQSETFTCKIIWVIIVSFKYIIIAVSDLPAGGRVGAMTIFGIQFRFFSAQVIPTLEH